ncbi:MAG: ribbon-helix-helix domain-containing protein [Alphaproteobacteria bacterium]
MDNSFVLKTFNINGGRTSIRLDKESIEVLEDICQVESVTFNKLIEIIDHQRQQSSYKMSRTAYLRIFLIYYLKQQIKEQSAIAKGDIDRITHMAKGKILRE